MKGPASSSLGMLVMKGGRNTPVLQVVRVWVRVHEGVQVVLRGRVDKLAIREGGLVGVRLVVVVRL